MLLRRMTHHLKSQNWFAVGLDFLIVVVGVFIGLQVGNWNDAARERAKETAILLQNGIEEQIDRGEAVLTEIEKALS